MCEPIRLTRYAPTTGSRAGRGVRRGTHFAIVSRDGAKRGVTLAKLFFGGAQADAVAGGFA